MSDRPTNRASAKHPVVPVQRSAGADFASGRVASPARRHRSPYLTTDRLAATQESLSTSDWAVLELVNRFGFATGPQLASALFGDDDSSGRAARRTLKHLSELLLLGQLDRRIGGVRAGSSGIVYHLGPAGFRLLGDKRRALDQPGLHHALHSLAITALFVRLRVAERTGTAKLMQFDPEPDCWRRYTGRHGEPVVLKPDAFCDVRVNGTRRLWFVEVDRGTVSTNSLRAKLARYHEYFEMGTEQAARSGVFPRVVWACDIERRSQHLRELCAAENERLGFELHRLLSEEWQPPPSESVNDDTRKNNNEGGEP